jgi:hypothetical protein
MSGWIWRLPWARLITDWFGEAWECGFRGLPRTYYIGVTQREAPPRSVCSAGLEEGQEIELKNRQFDLLIREPVEFPIFVSSSHDGPARTWSS